MPIIYCPSRLSFDLKLQEGSVLSAEERESQEQFLDEMQSSNSHQYGFPVMICNVGQKNSLQQMSSVRYIAPAYGLRHSQSQRMSCCNIINIHKRHSHRCAKRVIKAIEKLGHENGTCTPDLPCRARINPNLRYCLFPEEVASVSILGPASQCWRR